MAATAQGSRLTAQQRQLQLALRALTVRDVIAVWRLLDPTALGSTWPGVETALARIVSARRTQSALLAARYISAFRAAELGGGTAPVVPESPVDSAALRTSLAVTGPATIERLARTQTPAVAGRTAMTRVVGAVTRHVLDGGRAMLTDTIRADRQALGWARSASGSACAFCAMLVEAADRCIAPSGPRSSGRTTTAAAGSSRYTAETPRGRMGSERHREQWDAATSGLSGAKALNAYRASLPG